MQKFLVDLCFERVVSCHIVGNIVMIELPGLEQILVNLPSKWRINGLTAFTLNGYSMDVMPEYNPDFGAGVPVADALEIARGWPRDKGLWIEPSLTDWPPLWSSGGT